MAQALVPTLLGLRYQGWLFWQQAAGLLPGPGASPVHRSVTFEADTEARAFDDVVVELITPTPEGLDPTPVTHHHYQAKYHVVPRLAFNVACFTSPEFIGATTSTLLSRLGESYRALGREEFSRRRFWIVAPCPVDHTDDRMIELCRDNRHSLDLEVLRKGTTKASRWYELREAWRKATGAASDDELFDMLRCLRFVIGASDINGRFADHVSISLERVGLKRINPSEDNESYANIPWTRFTNGQNSRYLREDIEDIVERENLRAPGPDELRLGLRTDIEWGLDFDTAVDHYLKLEEHFEGRRIRGSSSWKRVYQDIQAFLRQHVKTTTGSTITFGAGLTVGFAAGYSLPTKDGWLVYPVQRHRGPARVWRDLAPVVTHGGWESPVVTKGPGTSADFAIGVSISQEVGAKMTAYVAAHLPHVGEIVEVRPAIGIGATIVDGAHAAHLVGELTKLIQSRRQAGMTGTTHLFIAAPVSFAFLLGQEQARLRRCQLYEYEFDVPDHPTYVASLLVPDDAAAD